MRTLFPVMALVLLAGCAMTQPKSEWRLVDGAWIGPATTYQGSSGIGAWGTRPCGEYPDAWSRWVCVASETSLSYFRDVKPGLDALGKMK